MKARSKKAIARFCQDATAGVSNTKLLRMIKYVDGYWYDFIRPTLVSLSCEAVGGQTCKVLDVEVMLSLADAGISIHDDIIDNTVVKKFRRTIFGLYGLNEALLAGDLLQMQGWSTLSKLLRKGYPPAKVAQCVDAYANCCINMCESQILETSFRKNLLTDLAAYNEMLWKANSSIMACTQLGAILGNGTQREVRALTDFGKSLGLLFGLKDEVKDTLNIEGNLLGRLKNESVPLPILYAAKTSDSSSSRIKLILSKEAIDSLDVKELLERCFETKAFDYILHIAGQESNSALAQLNQLKSTEAKDYLNLILEKLTNHVSEIICGN